MNSDIFNTAWTTTYNIISGNIPDPSTRGKKWIHPANPLIGSAFSAFTFPLITIDPFTLQDGRTSTMGLGYVVNKLATTIELHDNTSGSRFDALFGTIFKTLWNNRLNFANSGLTHLTITNGDYNQINISRNNRIHIRSLGLGFDNVTS